MVSLINIILLAGQPYHYQRNIRAGELKIYTGLVFLSDLKLFGEFFSVMVFGIRSLSQNI